MNRLCKCENRNIKQKEVCYGNYRATAFFFHNGVKIVGFKNGGHFDLRVLTVGFNPAHDGLGEEALSLLRPAFNKITVNEIFEATLPFWEKMRDRGLVTDLGTVKKEKDLGYIPPDPA
jgi:hypothetical protein